MWPRPLIGETFCSPRLYFSCSNNTVKVVNFGPKPGRRAFVAEFRICIDFLAFSSFLSSYGNMEITEIGLFDHILRLLAQKTRDILRIVHMLANFTQSIERRFHFVT